jgi:hypothetical protein
VYEAEPVGSVGVPELGVPWEALLVQVQVQAAEALVQATKMLQAAGMGGRLRVQTLVVPLRHRPHLDPVLLEECGVRSHRQSLSESDPRVAIRRIQPQAQHQQRHRHRQSRAYGRYQWRVGGRKEELGGTNE